MFLINFKMIISDLFLLFSNRMVKDIMISILYQDLSMLT
jgi:hypothetical protein